MKPKVSVIFPIYNGEKTLEYSLNSILGQTYSDFELIACIDGTSDRSEEILKNANDQRISILKNPLNMGLGRTLNRLIAHTDPDAPYIAIAEQDDWYYPYRLEKQIEFLEENPNVGLVSGIADHVNKGVITNKIPGMLHKGKQYPSDPVEMLRLNFRYKIKVQQTCMMFRKKIHLENGLYFSQHFHTIPIDWLYIMRFALIAEIKGLNIPLVKKDRSPGRNSATSNLANVYRGDRELIRSTYWEFSKILTKEDYKFAMNTQIFSEGKTDTLPKYFLRLFEALLNNPFDPRIKDYLYNLHKRVKNKLKNNHSV